MNIHDELKLTHLKILELKSFKNLNQDDLEVLFDVKNDYNEIEEELTLTYNVSIRTDEESPIFKVEMKYASKGIAEEYIDTREKMMKIIENIHPRIFEMVGVVLNEAKIISIEKTNEKDNSPYEL